MADDAIFVTESTQVAVRRVLPETKVVHIAAELSNAEAASILLYDEGKQQMYFEAASNMAEPLMRGLIVPVDSSIAGWVATNSQPLIISEAQDDPRFSKASAKLPISPRNPCWLFPSSRKARSLEFSNRSRG
jgi:signal transduction protein with GAF and PtsI domain